MIKSNRIVVAVIALIIITAVIILFSTRASQQQPSFNQFINQMAQRALKQGVSQNTIDRYLKTIQPPKAIQKTRVVKQHQHQAQKELTFDVYLKRLVFPKRIKEANELYQKNQSLLQEISQKYGVDSRIIVALWGIESNFGRYTGQFPLIQSLAILAYTSHRAEFFQKQLIAALKIFDQNKVIPPMMKSAFDGGMGQTQFMPEIYLAFAVDYRGDGFKDIWTDQADVFASIANYLNQHGWQTNQPWFTRVKLPDNFPIKLAGRNIKSPISDWIKLGVTRLNGKPLANIAGETAILLPAGQDGPAYLIYPNFYVLLRWNNTTFENLAVGTLANDIKR